jgi:hypothetical protein
MISNFLKYIQNNFAFSHRISRLDYLGFCLIPKVIIAKYHKGKLPFLNNPIEIFEYEAYEMILQSFVLRQMMWQMHLGY